MRKWRGTFSEIKFKFSLTDFKDSGKCDIHKKEVVVASFKINDSKSKIACFLIQKLFNRGVNKVQEKLLSF